MFRVVFSSIPEDLSNDEVYEYVLTHGNVGDQVANALRLKQVCSNGSSGAVIVDYANRGAAEEAIRHPLLINGSDAVTARLLGATHAPMTVPRAAGSKRQRTEKRAERASPDKDDNKAVNNVSDASHQQDSSHVITVRVSGLRGGAASGQQDHAESSSSLFLDDDAEVFKSIESIAAHHGGSLLRVDRITADEVNATIRAEGTLFRASLFHWNDHDNERATPLRRGVWVRLSDFSSFPEDDSADWAGHVHVSEECRNSLDATLLRRNYTQLQESSPHAATVVAKMLAIFAKSSKQHSSSGAGNALAPSVAVRDRFGNVVFIVPS